jgi:molybdopterin synthase catalytic subunit
MAVLTRLASSLISPEEELAQFIASADEAGAIVSFCGIARPRSQSGGAVELVHLDHYPGMTDKSLESIAREAMQRFSVSELRVVHRCGAILPGDTIVFVATASRHRRAAFEAADYLMDRLKTEAVFWKREEGSSGSTWIEPTQADYIDRGRWG